MKIINKCTATLLDSMGDDLSVANAARVSFDKWKDELDGKDERLIAYLASHNHWTPFTHVQVKLRMETPIFVARQWFKHQVGVSRNEVSRRYVDVDPVFYIPDQFHSRPEGGIKQGSGGAYPGNDQMHRIATDRATVALENYREDISTGLSPEEARMFLPQNTATAWVETGSLAYFARACALRLDPHAQNATRQLGWAVAEAVKDIAPLSWAALMEKYL
ncbi:FAD-dependent thymidylate synthase [Komagataeibacter oboediens]|uniref:FAD-dependent thymidylate synthase n=1 Tax=Komagataeibacter oboediens TaxID=65958 RepID=UPI0023D9E561|nr:FAD-dependent thymidylate synthase [Komagataeibacter oboediens]WEQ51169.1 FAD-dependent thymidylate synthase [Komagataeibacter oboediens]